MTTRKAAKRRSSGALAPTLRAMVEHVSGGSAPDSWKVAARELRALLAVARAAGRLRWSSYSDDEIPSLNAALDRLDRAARASKGVGR